MCPMSPLTVNLWAIVARALREPQPPGPIPATVDEEIASLREDGPDDPTGEAHARHAAMLCELEEEREQIALEAIEEDAAEDGREAMPEI